MTKHFRDVPEIPAVPAETEYLVSSMETMVNEHVDEYLDGYPFQVSVSDFHPTMLEGKLPSGIRRIDNSYISKTAPGAREFSGIDILMEFPIVPEAVNPLNITFKWTDGLECRIAIVDKLPIILVERGEEIIYSAILDQTEMTSYLNSSGLPESMWGSNIKDLIAETNQSRDVKLRHASTSPVDHHTSMEIVHDVRSMINDSGERELVQELCLNVDHLSQATGGIGNEIALPSTATFRNMLRFERGETSNAWEYRGAYEGKLEAGEFIDEVVQVDPKLGLPKSKVINKALNVLSKRPY
jgi:hypothetical protein